jgi:hypothetical protein
VAFIKLFLNLRSQRASSNNPFLHQTAPIPGFILEAVYKNSGKKILVFSSHAAFFNEI